MRERVLHDALGAFATEAAARLAADVAEGAEVGFEVVEHGRRSATPLYCYRPLTGGFIGERVALLAHLPSWPAALRALAALDGVGDYLRSRGEGRVAMDPRERAATALRVFLQAVFDEAGDFSLTPERFDAAWRGLEAHVFAGRAETVVATLVHGLEIESGEVPLADALSLWRPDALPEPPPGLAERSHGAEGTVTVAVAAVAGEDGGPEPIGTAVARLHRLLTAVRLFDDARPAMEPLGWTRAGAGAWRPLALAVDGRAEGVLTVGADGEDELRAFCSLVARRTPRAGELAWALRRYERACERPAGAEALTDVLLALRALLEPEGPVSGRLAGRLAALCASPDGRAPLTERIAQAAALERGVIAGVAGGRGGAEALGVELAGHLRALLRDVLCGHLDPDLRGLADDLIAEQAASA